MRAVAFLIGCLGLGLVGCECDFFEPGDVDGGSPNGRLGDGCMATSDCRLGLVCTGGLCDGARDGVEGSPCELTADCTDGLYCAPDRMCATAGQGGAGADCDSTADCVQGFVCIVEGFSGVCRMAGAGDIGAMCGTDVDCAAGLACQMGEGGARTCQSPGASAGDAGVPRPLLPLWAGETCDTTAEDPPIAYFTVPTGDRAVDGDFYRLPFPNDIRRSANGLDLSNHPTPSTALDVDVVGRHIEVAEEDLNGFATNPVIYFRFSVPYEWNDVTGDTFLLIDITPGSPEYGLNLGRAWLTTAGRITRYICPNWLAMRRGHGAPLRAGTTYAAVLLRGVRAGEGDGHVTYARAPDLDAVLAATRPGGEPLATAWDRYQPLRDFLESPEAEFTSDDVLTVAQFTTQDPTAQVPALREVIRADAAPTLTDVTLCDGVATSPCDDGGARRCGPVNDDYWEIHARINLPRFQAGTPPYATPEDGGGIALDAMGRPIAQATESVCMVMTIPKVTSEPTQGFPLVIFGHGTGGAFTSAIDDDLARTFASDDGGSGAPRAITVGFDLPMHGTRRGASTREPRYLVFNYANPRASRDNFMQGAADFLSLVYWAESFSLPAAQAPTGFDVRFDPSRIAIVGHSQGAGHAMLMIPFEPSVRAAVISGGGGDLTESLLSKTSPIDIAHAVPLALLDPDADGSLAGGDNHPALALIQS
ncbi:MAG: hypothetical protein AB7P00_24860, partial [Sandaracinaceae bacterium]